MSDTYMSMMSLPLFDPVTPGVRFLVATIVCASACLLLWVLAALHRHRLHRIPVRIHVAGTRGKSTVVRLVAAGLRAGGYRVVAKVTGTEPVTILPDGSERRIRRWGAAAIREQRHFISAARRAGADAIVVEAMAIEPEYLRALERFYIRATDLIITNVRPDHQEQLGPDPGAMAAALAQAMPHDSRVFLAAEAAVDVVLERAAAHGSEVSIAPAGNEGEPEDANRMLALDVCRRYGVADEIAIPAMQHAQRDIGEFTVKPLSIEGRSVRFANAFSCNDVQSFELLWRRHQPAERPSAFLFNARSDRPLRSREFLNALARLSPGALLFLTPGGGMLRGRARRAGFAPARIHLLPGTGADAQLRAVAREVADGTVVWGTGNFKGAGAAISERVSTLPLSC